MVVVFLKFPPPQLFLQPVQRWPALWEKNDPVALCQNKRPFLSLASGAEWLLLRETFWPLSVMHPPHPTHTHPLTPAPTVSLCPSEVRSGNADAAPVKRQHQLQHRTCPQDAGPATSDFLSAGNASMCSHDAPFRLSHSNMQTLEEISTGHQRQRCSALLHFDLNSFSFNRLG